MASAALAGAAGGTAALFSHCRFKFSNRWIPTHPYLPQNFCFRTPPCTIQSRSDGVGLNRSTMSQASSDGPVPDGAVETEEKKDADVDVVVQYVVLRRDLIDAWPLGSVVTQGCHASVSAIWSHRDDPLTVQYCSPDNIDSMHKVTLEVKGETQMLNLVEKLKDSRIAHKLWIEQPENIPTCLATKPYPKSVVSSFFKKLKLAK